MFLFSVISPASILSTSQTALGVALPWLFPLHYKKMREHAKGGVSLSPHHFPPILVGQSECPTHRVVWDPLSPCLPPPGILHKGTGENQFLTQQPAIITSIMGNGRRRSISCPSCNGLAEGNKLLAPVALAVGIDGSLFVGDFNYIRRIFPSRNVTSILELR